MSELFDIKIPIFRLTDFQIHNIKKKKNLN